MATPHARGDYHYPTPGSQPVVRSGIRPRTQNVTNGPRLLGRSGDGKNVTDGLPSLQYNGFRTQNVTVGPARRTRQRYATDIRRTQTQTDYPTIDQQFNVSYENAGIAGQYRRETIRTDPLSPTDRTRNVWIGHGTPRSRKRFKPAKKDETWEKAEARFRVSMANVWVLSWAWFLYTVLLPFNMANWVAAGMAAVIYGAILEVGGRFKVLGGLDGLEALTARLFSSSSWLISRISDLLFGIPFDPLHLWGITWIIVWSFNFFSIMAWWGIYSAYGVKSLSGQAELLKHGALMIALVGTFVPFLSIFPLILVWPIVVWLYPR